MPNYKVGSIVPQNCTNSIITQSGFLIRPPLCCILSFRWWRLLSYQAVEFHIHNRIQEAVNSQSLFQIVLFFPVSEKVMSSGRCECARSAWFRSLWYGNCLISQNDLWQNPLHWWESVSFWIWMIEQSVNSDTISKNVLSISVCTWPCRVFLSIHLADCQDCHRVAASFWMLLNTSALIHCQSIWQGNIGKVHSLGFIP